MQEMKMQYLFNKCFLIELILGQFKPYTVKNI